MLTLQQIRSEWNGLVPIAQERGLNIAPWNAVPADRQYGLHRVNWLRAQLGLAPLEGAAPLLEASTGAHLSMRQLQEAWNALVPLAQARGIRASTWRTYPHSAQEGLRRLAWLRSQLGTVSVPAIAGVVPAIGYGVFDGWTFGVEIECFMPHGMTHAALSGHLRAAGIECLHENYNHLLRPHWKVITDGSLGNYSRGAEIVSPKLSGPEGFAQLHKVCDVLKEKRIRTSRRCGLHVHVGAAEQSAFFFRNIEQLYRQHELTIDQFMAESRRMNANQYCNSCRNRLMSAAFATMSKDDLIANLARYGRWRKLNFQSYARHKTVEFRHHHGTIKKNDIEFWVRFCLRMAITAKRLGPNGLPEGNAGTSFDALTGMIELDQEEKAFYQGRIAHFARRDTISSRWQSGQAARRTF